MRSASISNPATCIHDDHYNITTYTTGKCRRWPATSYVLALGLPDQAAIGRKNNVCSVVQQHSPRILTNSNVEVSSDIKEIIALCNKGKLEDAIDHLEQHEVRFDSKFYGTLIRLCGNRKALAEGIRVHKHITDYGPQDVIFLGNLLVEMYGKCGDLKKSRDVFAKMRRKNVYSWTAIITACVQHDLHGEALHLFRQMRHSSLEPDAVILTTMLKTCTSPESLAEGRLFHAFLVDYGFRTDSFMQTALVNMYGKIGSLAEAQDVLDNMQQRNVVSWTAMIAAYAQHGHEAEALLSFTLMQQEGVKPNEVTFLSTINACTALFALAEGRVIHACIIGSNFKSDIGLSTALLNLYGKCGHVEDAYTVFLGASDLDTTCCNAMMATFSQHGYSKEALQLFQLMLKEHVRLDKFTYSTGLTVCADLYDLEEGKRIHNHIINDRLEHEVILQTALINMYSKCGNLTCSHEVFGKMLERDVILWNAMIVAYAQHGFVDKALQMFSQMQHAGIKPNRISYLNIISACGHAGLLQDGCYHLVSMSANGIIPVREHFGCMVDLLGRAGKVNVAEDIIQMMPFEPDEVSWVAFLGACITHNHYEQALVAAQHSLEFYPSNDAVYVLLSNMYAIAGMWDEVRKVRQLMKDRGIKKKAGRSAIDVNNARHEFVAGDILHPQAEEIYGEWDRLSKEMKKLGYVPSIGLALHDVEDELKENLLAYHSEKLAVCFGLISTPDGTPLRIIKNLRICPDCHVAIKCIAKITEREIVVRDANRFHHFKDGICTCGDYW